MTGPGLLRAALLGLPLGCIPLTMGGGLLRGGLWAMLEWGAYAAGAVLALRLTTTTALEAWLAGATPVRTRIPIVDELAARAGTGAPTILSLPRPAGCGLFTTSWRRRAPVLFISADLLVPGATHTAEGGSPTLHPDAEGGLAHELCHVRSRDVLWKHVALVGSVFARSLSLVSPLGAARDVLARASLPELFIVMCAPLITWIGATQYSALARWLELRADRHAVAVAGPERLARSIRRLADPDPRWIFATHPSRAERLAQIRGPLEPVQA